MQNIFQMQQFSAQGVTKKDFLERLDNVTTSQELLNLYRLFEKNYEILKKLNDSNIEEYTQLCNYGKILLQKKSDELDAKIENLIRTGRTYYDEELYNQALMYFYEVDSVEKISKTQTENKHIENTNIENTIIGNIGEEVVEYALSWLDKEYVRVPAESVGKYEQKCILIQNKEYKDECQEYDHIVVGPQGVFLIETKNYAGEITIDEEGNWIREKKDGSVKGERNPIQQVRRHEKLIKSIVGDTNVISVICLSHPNVILYGAENSSIKVVKSDLLGEYIENYKVDNLLTAEEIDSVVDKIKAYMV